MNRRKWLLTLVVLAGLGAGAALSWALMDTMFHATGDYKFCVSCHSHAPIGASYREDLHGGNNPSGWRATCSDCHISHDNSLAYLWVKAVHGVVDPTMEILKDSYAIDWHGHREQRASYTYDSGCMNCHLYLREQTEGNPKAFLPHRSYFNEPGQHNCVDCHQHVGHKRLGYHLEAMGWKIPEEGSNNGTRPE